MMLLLLLLSYYHSRVYFVTILAVEPKALSVGDTAQPGLAAVAVFVYTSLQLHS